MKNEYQVIPYKGVDGLFLESKRATILKKMEPSRTKKNKYSSGITDYYESDFIQLVYDADSNGGDLHLKEISFRKGCGSLLLDRINFFSDDSDVIFDYLNSNDPDFKDIVGIIMFPKFGLALSGFGNEPDDNEGRDKNVTVFAKERFNAIFNE